MSQYMKILIVYMGALLVGMVLVSVPSNVILLKSNLGLSDSQYGGLFISQLIAATLGALIAAPAVKRFSLKSMYLVALVCLFLSPLCLYKAANASELATGIMLLNVGLAFFGFGFGFGGGPMNGLVVNLFPDNSGPALTAFHTLAGVGLMLGPIYFDFFSGIDLWNASAIALALLALAMFVLGLFILEQDKPLIVDELAGEVSPAKSVYFWSIVVIAFIYALVEGIFSNWALIFLNQIKGFALSQAALALSIFWAGFTLGRLLTTFLLLKVSAQKIWYLLPLFMAAVLYALPSVSSENQGIWMFALAGLSCSAFFPLMITVAGEAFPNSISWVVSILTASLMVGVGLGSMVVGNLIEAQGMESIYRSTALLSLLLLALMVVALKFLEPSQSR